ncbi:hypothetical protein [Nocardioides zeae]|uniref:Secreted protein n=1 Tax=Nocardioides zeae TaxID=1457234 RepID=A0A6P0HD54_9ACTN|nr:hypothetical protein [Nocardioides zeae]NEN76798.1 hypothetical protein [Nocardioides zeae]
MRSSSMKFGAVVAGAAVVMAGSALGASAASKSKSLEVECNGTSVATGTTIVQGSTGTFKIRQDSADDNRRTDWNAVSSNGNSLGYKMTGTGDTVSWSGVRPSTYTVKAKKYVPSDCSVLPFNGGSYTVNYTVTSRS